MSGAETSDSDVSVGLGDAAIVTALAVAGIPLTTCRLV